MRLLDRYILSEWLKAFGMAIMAILGILIIERVQDDLPDFLSWGATTEQILKCYLYRIPSFLPMVLPLSLLVSVLFTLGNLHRNNEIVAMRVAGLNFPTITRSLLAAGLLLALIVLYLNASLVPYSIEQARTIQTNLRFASEATRTQKENIGVMEKLTFDNRKERRLWVMNRFSEYTFQGYGVTVYILDPSGRDVERLMAKTAYYDDIDRAWVLQEGREMHFDPATGEAIFDKKFDRRVFPNFNETPTLMKTLSKAPGELSFIEITQLLETIPAENNPEMTSYAVRYQMILASPFACLIAVAIGIPFAVAGVRTRPIGSVVKAGILFLSYSIITSACQVLGNQQILSPIIAAWMPNLIMCAVALGLWKRLR